MTFWQVLHTGIVHFGITGHENVVMSSSMDTQVAAIVCLISSAPLLRLFPLSALLFRRWLCRGSADTVENRCNNPKQWKICPVQRLNTSREYFHCKVLWTGRGPIKNFRDASKDLKDIHIKVEKGFTPFNCLHLFALKLASMGIVFICAWQALQGQMSMAFFRMFVLFSFVMFGSVENINDAAHTLGVVDSAMNKLEALENVNYIDQDGTDIKPATYDIEFRDVSFGYDSRIVSAWPELQNSKIAQQAS